jgi:hypothetical protein
MIPRKMIVIGYKELYYPINQSTTWELLELVYLKLSLTKLRILPCIIGMMIRHSFHGKPLVQFFFLGPWMPWILVIP